ncbi:hypothetical protein MPLA_30067 [Mesorhizobium sp. ORS 3359]|nr:hypothetical protein MPLA_30067 [Mesorhizobium sp. ORS 3359]
MAVRNWPATIAEWYSRHTAGMRLKARCTSQIFRLIPQRKMARVTGLEPATSGVTGRHSNRLSYTRALTSTCQACRR